MARVIVSAVAAEDLIEILTVLEAQAGVKIANRYQHDFTQVYEQLAQFPGSGAPRPELGGQTRVVVVSPYLMFYEHDTDLVTVIRVLHGRRNITRNLIRG